MSDGVFLVGAGFGGQDPSGYPDTNVSGVARLFEAAKLDRLNEAHWADVSSQPINDELRFDLDTIQRRAVYEAINNPLIEAAIETHATDVCGEHGPSLQMLTGKTKFDNAIEQLWSDWCESAEYQHGLALVDLLQGWVGQLWYHGEFLCQDIIGKNSADFKVLDLGADRLDIYHPDEKIVMGVEINATGQPVAYHITDPGKLGRGGLRSLTRRVPADLITHGFRRRFAGQLRGIPIMASGLPNAADLRDYKTSVMDAARAAADQAIWFVSDHPDAPYTPWAPSERWNWQRRTARQAAPGWKPMQIDARQPTAQYKDFREEEERDLVLASQMPLMILRKDSSKHNLSSARFDGVRYTRSIMRLQAWFNRRALAFFLDRVITLARLDGTLRMDAPKTGMKLRWSWPKPPSNDPVKDRMAERLGLENGTLSYSQALGDQGLRTDQIIEQRAKDNAALLAAGLSPLIGPIPTKFNPAVLPWVDDQEDDQEDSTSSPTDTQETEGQADA